MLERYGEEHERVGAALHNVAVANLRAGLLDDAKDAIEEAVRIRRLTLGEEHPKVAVSSMACLLEHLSSTFFADILMSPLALCYRSTGLFGGVWNHFIVNEAV